jgi:predicted phage terminase large subunit-like protein
VTAPACAALATALREQAAGEPPRPPPYDGLLSFIAWLVPEYRPPHHLAAWVALIERAARGEPVRALCSVPIRHFKSQTTMAGIVWLLTLDPTMRILVLTHSFDRARQMGKRIRDLATAAGVGPTFRSNTIDDWSNDRGGGVIVMSAEQSRLGADVHLVFFDDPLDEHASMNHLRRSAVDETIAHYTARCMRNGKPGAVLGVMSRWHPDDPIGRREGREAVKWEYIHHPAIIDEGGSDERAFAPEVWSLAALRKVRAELAEADPVERIWWAQFQGDPKPEGSSLFSPHPERYDALPAHGSFRLAYGADLAFTQGAHSDYFGMVALKVFGTKAYLLESMRAQLVPHMIESTCRAFIGKYGAGPIYTYASGPEWGTIRNMASRGLRFVAMKARYNKLVRAERTIKRWNDGQILVPAAGAWVPGFLSRVEIFRGEDKGHDDDEIDALVAASDGSSGSGVAGVKVLGASYGGMSSARPSGAPAR